MFPFNITPNPLLIAYSKTAIGSFCKIQDCIYYLIELFINNSLHNNLIYTKYTFIYITYLEMEYLLSYTRH